MQFRIGAEPGVQSRGYQTRWIAGAAAGRRLGLKHGDAETFRSQGVRQGRPSYPCADHGGGAIISPRGFAFAPGFQPFALAPEAWLFLNGETQLRQGAAHLARHSEGGETAAVG